MFISRVAIANFRNFKDVTFETSRNVVLLGENKAGKSNLLFALRLILDPSLPDSARKLRREDVWDGIENLGPGERIKISVDLSDFEENPDQVALLADHLVEPTPMVARLTYVWEPRKNLKEPAQKESDFDFYVYGGDRPENIIYGDLRRRLPMELLPALRDCEADLARWTRSPLRPMLDLAAKEMPKEELAAYAGDINTASDKLTKAKEITKQAARLDKQLEDMVGKNQALDLLLRFAPVDADRLIRSLRIFIDGGKRGVSDASLGSTNILFFALKMLEYQQLVAEGDRDHTFLAIEEPEAHLHPNLQRLIFRNYLRLRGDAKADENLPEANVWVSTHSPHIASVAPLGSFVLLRNDGSSTSVVSTAKLTFTEREKQDLERYLDVSRGEMLFARGVLLVEGDAEQFLIPVLAAKLGYDLDELGIAICSVSGTNFAPYVRFLSTLKMPFAVLTDYDPNSEAGKPSYCWSRVEGLLEILDPDTIYTFEDEATVLAAGTKFGVFTNKHTFEVDLFNDGRDVEFDAAMTELKPDTVAAKRMTGWNLIGDLDTDQFLKDIDEVGKGRFAQRLSSIMQKSDSTKCPDYISNALKYVAVRATTK